VRERKRRETHARIIEKGLKLFVKHGYEGTTLDAIADAAALRDGSARPEARTHYFGIMEKYP
jgi:AcrR family transcriptional regulator